MTLIALLAGLSVLGASVPLSATANVPVTLMASEHVIRVTPTYTGELVKLLGTAPAQCAVVVKLVSLPRDLVCSRKGKVGPFWLSVGRVRFRNVPLMYKVNSSQFLDDVVAAGEQVRYGLGRRGLKASIGAQPGREGGLYLDELILVQQRARLYDFEEGTVERDGDAFRTKFFWPPDAPPGRYLVEAYAAKGGRVVGFASSEIDVRAVGIEAWVRRLAHSHGLLYGLLSVALAAVTGLGATLAFGARSRRGPGRAPSGAH
jgi:uncharacterized protein (TIGR02186 family)